MGWEEGNECDRVIWEDITRPDVETKVGPGTAKNHPTTRRQSLAVL